MRFTDAPAICEISEGCKKEFFNRIGKEADAHVSKDRQAKIGQHETD